MVQDNIAAILGSRGAVSGYAGEASGTGQSVWLLALFRGEAAQELPGPIGRKRGLGRNFINLFVVSWGKVVNFEHIGGG